jgi:O-acetyl-ADP-ribose deacetylase (regulator of RNase III)
MSKFEITFCDITKLKVDAIVNAANETLLGGGGVDGAIHKAAGPRLLIECKTLHGCETGKAKITNGYDLPAKYVIHAVGPVYDREKAKKCDSLLVSCYVSCLEIAKEHNIHSIAFPNISTGVYLFPKDKAVKIVKKTVENWLKQNPNYDLDITFCCFDYENYLLYKQEFAL